MVTPEPATGKIDPDIERGLRRYRRRRRAAFVLKPIAWLLTSVAVAATGSASISDDVTLFKAMFPSRQKGTTTRCAYLPALSSRSSRPRSSVWNELSDRILGPGVTEHGTITTTDDAYLWSPDPRDRSLGATDFRVRIDTVEGVECRRLHWGAVIVRIDSHDGEFVTFRLAPVAANETFGNVAAA